MSAPQEVRFYDKQIEMAHGAGGEASRRIVEGLFAPLLLNPALAALSDAAVLDLPSQQVALTTDCFVVRPLRFPGGSIGELAVNGTVNDLAVSGAVPVALTASFVLEAGLDAEVLRDAMLFASGQLDRKRPLGSVIAEAGHAGLGRAFNMAMNFRFWNFLNW